MIKAQNICFYYNKDTPLEKQALNNINFEIDTGDCIGIVGPSGSGKSTLAQHFNGLFNPSSGKIIIDGQEITGKKSVFSELRKRVGLIFQFPEDQLFENTVYKDIIYGIKDIGLSNEEINLRIKKVFKLFNLDFEKIAYRSPFDLSGGEKRKVAMAGIFVMEPSILILDEPTAGLDPVSLREMIIYIKNLKDKKNKTIIIISHNMEIIACLCSKVLGLKNGKIEFFGYVSELLNNEKIMQSLNLCLPPIASLFHKLIKEGFDLRDDIVGAYDAAQELFSKIITK